MTTEETQGFAIRCPNCGKWNEYPTTHPSKLAVTSEDEFDFIMNEFRVAKGQGEVGAFAHPKLVRCERPRWSCPASFEAFIFESERTALVCLDKVPEAWAISRDFRLFKSDKKNRWDKEEEKQYFCIMFCTEQVPRHPDIELENLMNRELVSRAIVGVGCEIEAPFTVYAANIFEPTRGISEVYWMPIEAYQANGEQLVPPKYNDFCRRCREVVMKRLVQDYESNRVSVENCPVGFGKDAKCAGKRAACSRRDWNHCPAFIKERDEKCPCYNSDLEAIERIVEKWKGGELTFDSKEHRCGLGHRCHAGFREVSFPIVVHDRLAGVAMSGQVFFGEEELVGVDEFVKKWGNLQDPDSRLKLKTAKQVLLFDEQQRLGKGDQGKFLINQEQFRDRVEQLKPHVANIEEMANVRYRDIRSRSEAAFRQEILALIQRFKKVETFFEGPILEVLERMRKFWAFRSVGFVWHSSEAKDLRIVAFSSDMDGKNCAFSLPGEEIGKVRLAYRQRHPLHWVCDPKDPEVPRNRWIKELLPVVDEAKGVPGLELPEDGLYFIVVVPIGDDAYAFVFVDRDGIGVGDLAGLSRGGISELCQEFMLRTCTEIMREFGDVLAFSKFHAVGKSIKKIPIDEVPAQKKTVKKHKQAEQKTGTSDEKS